MTDHYFSESPGTDWAPREIDVVLGGSTHQVVTAGGVFSPDHLDRGTETLLRALALRDEDAGQGQPPRRGATPRILDLGCGWGAIALDAALTTAAAEVWAVDVNERSRALTGMNADRLGLTNIRVARPEDVPESIRFSEIRSNPPIRVGKSVLHEMLRQWLPRLESGGTASLVVAKHLGAESLLRWIATEFGDFDVTRAHRARGFHVIEASRG